MTVKLCQTDDIATCLALRKAVFIDEQGVTRDEDIDGLDGAARHLLASVDGRPVGTARLLVEGDIGKIGRVCVLPPHRGTGLGLALIRTALDVFGEQKTLRIVRLSAQISALGFYEKLGFVAHGDEYLDAGILHRDMDHTL